MTADLHLHPFRLCSMNSGRDRLDDGLDVLRQSLSAARELDCPWVFGGDLKHIKNSWFQYALNRAKEILDQFGSVPKIMIHGNHDGTAGGSGLLPFANESTLVIDSPEIIEWAGITAAVWPHSNDVSLRPSFLAQAKKKNVRLLLGHQFMANAAVGPKDHPIVQGATLQDFGLDGKRVFDWAFLGDVHKQQILAGSGGKNATVVYPGSPYALNWGELEENKSALLVDLRPNVAHPVVPIPIKAPRFRIMDLTEIDKNKIKGELDKMEKWQGDFIRMIVGPEFSQKTLAELKKVLGARWFEIVVRRKPSTETRADIHAGLTRREIIYRYVKARPPVEPVTDAARLLTVGLKLGGVES